ncbi:MAG: hypothetical protein HY077_02680 [Elusimicrobia bacterium]|nr:hypothetical protein [Elusimicrobiota bacterium]
MNPLDPENPQNPPAPPVSLPPSGPPAELLRGGVPHVPLTPMMDFFSRRLEALERELSVEREKARSAQSQILQQEALRGDVEGHLKAMTEQLRREKAEREAEDMKSHARGRIDALEKRLDEMHQSWVTLLKEAVTSRETGTKDISTSQQALAKEQNVLSQEQALLKTAISGLTGTIGSLMEQIGAWRSETQAFTRLLPELKSLSSELPEGSRRFEGEIAKMLGAFSADLRERMAAWQRGQELDAQRQTERLRQLGQERETMQHAWEESNHGLRAEQLKERTAREAQLEGRIAELGGRFQELLLSQQKAAVDAGRVREDLAKTISMLTTPPKAKDAIIAGLEQERDDLLKALDERTREVHLQLEGRRHAEKAMGDALAALDLDMKSEREKTNLSSSRITELEFENAKLKDEVAMHGRSLVEKDRQLGAMASERDSLARSLVEEAQKVRAFLEDRTLSEEAWRAKFGQLEQRITSEIELRAKETTVAAELRAQYATLAEHLTRAIQERDAVSGRTEDFEAERHKLTSAVRQKDEMISLLNAAFQNMLKKT